MNLTWYKDLEGIIIADDNDDFNGRAFSLVIHRIWIYPYNRSIQPLWDGARSIQEISIITAFTLIDSWKDLVLDYDSSWWTKYDDMISQEQVDFLLKYL